MSTVMTFEVTKKQSLQEFGQIFEEHYDLAYRTAYSITRSAEDAEDVVQTIFLRLLRSELPPDLTNPKGYFYRAAVNISLKTIRSKQRHILTGDGTALEASAEMRSRERGVEKESDSELDQVLWRAIAELNETAAQILILRYIHDYSLADIAKLLGTSRGTIAVSLFRSRARLKKLMRAPKPKGEAL